MTKLQEAVKGTKMKLQWGETADKKMTWYEAVNYCKSLGKGWRLPTRIEHLERYDSGNIEGFKDDYYWSSTTNATSTAYAWLVNFYLGLVDDYSKTGNYYVRPVRGPVGQCIEMQNKILKVNWVEYISLINKLAGLIKKSGKHYKAIYGVPRGGLIPAVILSHKLGIDLISHEELCNIGDIDNPMKIENVIVCDDIIDSGKSRERAGDFDFACLHFKKIGKNSDDWNIIGDYGNTYGVKEIDKDTKVLYPYEKEVSEFNGILSHSNNDR